MKKTKLKLKPCPFCGGAAEPLVRVRATGKRHVVGCRNIGCGVSVETDEYDTPEEAAEAWNGRPVYRWLLATADGIDGALSNCGPSRRYVDVNVDYLAKIAQDLRAAACGDFTDSKIALKPEKPTMAIDTVAQHDMVPWRVHAADAGADLQAAENVTIVPYGMKTVRTGVRVAIPKGYVGLLFARSSLCQLGVIMANGVGVVDSGYTGEIKVPLFNASPRVIELPVWARIAQLVIVSCELPAFRRVDKLEETERGEGGFGSTGVE